MRYELINSQLEWFSANERAADWVPVSWQHICVVYRRNLQSLLGIVVFCTAKNGPAHAYALHRIHNYFICLRGSPWTSRHCSVARCWSAAHNLRNTGIEDMEWVRSATGAWLHAWKNFRSFPPSLSLWGSKKRKTAHFHFTTKVSETNCENPKTKLRQQIWS